MWKLKEWLWSVPLWLGNETRITYMIKPKNLHYLLFLFLLSCGNNNSKVKTSISKNKDSIVSTDSWDIIYDDSTFKIIGDSSAVGKIRYGTSKFRPFISFEDYPSKGEFQGEPAQIDYKSHKLAREYKTAITGQYKSEKVNFAGYYCLASWGCGFPCEACAIVDVRTGKVYPGPNSSIGYSYNSNSRLLIVNPPDENGFVQRDADFEYYPSVFIWNEEQKVWVKKLPGYEGVTWEKVNMKEEMFW